MATHDKLGDAATPEVVAYRLLMHVLEAEGRLGADTSKLLSRNLLLDAYSDCLEAVKGARVKGGRRVAAAA